MCAIMYLSSPIGIQERAWLCQFPVIYILTRSHHASPRVTRTTFGLVLERRRTREPPHQHRPAPPFHRVNGCCCQLAACACFPLCAECVWVFCCVHHAARRKTQKSVNAQKPIILCTYTDVGCLCGAAEALSLSAESSVPLCALPCAELSRFIYMHKHADNIVVHYIDTLPTRTSTLQSAGV